MDNYSINTKCVQAGYTPGNGEPRQIPIIQSTTFKYDTSEDMGKLFDLEASGNFLTLKQVDISTQDFRIQLMIMWQLRLQPLKVEVQQCLLHQDRQLISSLYLIFAKLEAI